MFEEASGKKFILYEWDGNNNKVELNQRSVKGNLVWFASNKLNSVNDWESEILFLNFLNISISNQGFHIILMQFFTCELV